MSTTPEEKYDTTRPPTHATRARNSQINAVHAMNAGDILRARVQALLATSSALLALAEGPAEVETTVTVPREQQLVREFHETFGHPVALEPSLLPREGYELRHRLLGEELDEYLAACENGDIVEIADALADLQYVLSGTFVAHGLNAGPLVAEVHRSNMSKLGEDGKPIYREDGKILKGPRFELPQLAHVIAEQPQL